MASRRDDPAGPSTLPVSPSVIVGIVILCAFCVMVLVASVFAYCRNNRSTTTDAEADDGYDIFNPNRPVSASQAARMREVRWINNMYAWERAREARKEVGEVRNTALFVGRVGEERHWDEWSSIGTGDGDSASKGKTFKDSAQDYTRVPLFYGSDDPYAVSSLHRSSHLMPSSARGSYRSSQYSGLPQYPSMLLPQPIPRDTIQGPFKRRQPPTEMTEPIEAQTMQNDGNNPKITINNGVEDLTRCSSITYHPNIEGFATNSNDEERLSPTLTTTTNDNDVDISDTFSALPLRPHTPNSLVVHNENNQVVFEQELRPADPSQAQEDQPEHRPSQEGVKAMIEEWEKTNGRFARHN
ncbi:hypothetical protein LTS17_010550 [Exophiala oligosperma]